VRDRFPLFLAGALALGGGLVVLLTWGARRGDFAGPLSTHRSQPGGARALYLLLDAAGPEVRRRTQELTLLEPGQHLVLLGVPGVADEARDWPDGGAPRSTWRRESLSEEEVQALLAHAAAGATVVAALEGPFSVSLAGPLGVYLEAPEDAELRTLVVAQPSRWVDGVERVESKVATWLWAPPEALPLLEDQVSGQVAATAVPYGSGTVVLLGTPALAMNEALPLADNARLWVALGRRATAQGGVLAFDEYHHGFRGTRSTGALAGRFGLHVALAQLLLGVVAWALSLRRFGQPAAPPEEARVGALDHLKAQSRLYQAGRHVGHAALQLVLSLSHELAGRAGTPGGSVEQVSAGLRRRGRVDLGTQLTRLHGLAQATEDEADLLEVAALTAQVRQQLVVRKPSPRLSQAG
jgi:hypothetical protein